MTFYYFELLIPKYDDEAIPPFTFGRACCARLALGADAPRYTRASFHFTLAGAVLAILLMKLAF